MTLVFLEVFNRSIAAGWLILAVILLRLLLGRAPKWSHCMLWGIVALRLLCPFSFESMFSLIPSAETISAKTVQFAQQPAVDSGIQVVDDALNPVIGAVSAPDPGASVNPLYVWTGIAGVVWAAGLTLMLGYALVSAFLLKRRVQEAVLWQDSVWICDKVGSPFILGIFHPRIYVFSGMDESFMEYVIAHERAHLKRRDHWWKPLGFCLLSVYWFHPLFFVAYALFCRDIEMACDEKVIAGMDLEERKAYSDALLACSMRKKTAAVSPLAFGEIKVRERVKKILHYQKPAVWIAAAALLSCMLVAVCFLTNPQGTAEGGSGREQDAVEQDGSGGQEKSLEEMIGDAIIEHNTSYPQDYDYVCSDFVTLETESRSVGGREKKDIITFYGWALYQCYSLSEEGLCDVGGSHVPVALTFEVTADGKKLIEYWEPRDGSYFLDDLMNKFPASVAVDKAKMDSQSFIYPQMMNCYAQVVSKAQMSTFSVIGRHLDRIYSNYQSDPDAAFHINGDDSDYRELICYGEFTLAYRSKFDDAAQLGTFRHEVLESACREIEEIMAGGYYRGKQ